jgi:hypothetical protein
MTRFNPVWLSTDTQIQALIEGYRKASWKQRILGNAEVPPGVAHLKGWLIPWMRVPLAFVAEGSLEVREDAISFTVTPLRAPGWTVRDVRPDVGFHLSTSEITAVEAADVSSPVGTFFNLPFTRLTTTRPPPLNDFLLCVGGRLSMPRIRERSYELRRALETLAPASTAR